LARHIASHPVTVTERDTVPRASRHIRHTISGGVDVTRDQVEGWKGRDGGIHSSFPRSIDIRLGQHQPRHSAEHLAGHDVLGLAIEAKPTATAFAHTVPTRQQGIPAKACNCCVCADRTHDDKSRERVFARESNHNLGKDRTVSAGAQAIGTTASLVDRISLRLGFDGPLTSFRAQDARRNAPVMCAYIIVIVGQIDPGMGGVGGELCRLPINPPAISLQKKDALKLSFRVVAGIPTARGTMRQDSAAAQHRVARPVRWWVGPGAAGRMSGPFLSHGGACRHE
jgi:hypothetical protein